MQTLYSVNELAERWGYAPDTIRRMENEGTLHRVLGLPGVKFSAAEVHQLESIGPEAKALTAWERKRLEMELREKDAIIAGLRKKIADIMAILMMEVRDE